MAKIGIQFYTLGKQAKKDLPGAIGMVKAVGYEGIEFDAGMLQQTDSINLKKHMDSAQLDVIGMTLLLPELQTSLQPMIDFALITEAEWIVMPWIDQKLRKTPEDYQPIADKLNVAGQNIRDSGLRFAYHIHGYEFAMINNKRGIDVLMTHLDFNLVELQVDTFWVESAGIDCVEFSKQYIDQIGSFHMKDAASFEPLTDTEVGEGLLDMESIVRLGLSHGIEWFIVEQEETRLGLAESIKRSQKNLRKLIDNTAAR